jgi:hypothetical protein
MIFHFGINSLKFVTITHIVSKRFQWGPLMLNNYKSKQKFLFSSFLSLFMNDFCVFKCLQT